MVVIVGLTVGLDKIEIKPAGLLIQLYVLPSIAAEPISVELPVQIALAIPALAKGRGLTVTITLLVLSQPVAVIVSVKVYVVVIVGLTMGFDKIEVKPSGLLIQLYVLLSITSEPISVELPVQIALAVPALAKGRGLTVTITLLVLLQPVAVIVSVKVYVVVIVGLTVGFDKIEVKPVGLLIQLYALPDTAIAPI